MTIGKKINSHGGNNFNAAIESNDVFNCNNARPS
jgi:hypothetical protein